MRTIAAIIAGILITITVQRTWAGAVCALLSRGGRMTAVDRPMFACPCGREYPSYLAALDCEDQDILEDQDRKSGRLFAMHRHADDIDPQPHRPGIHRSID